MGRESNTAGVVARRNVARVGGGIDEEAFADTDAATPRTDDGIPYSSVASSSSSPSTTRRGRSGPPGGGRRRRSATTTTATATATSSFFVLRAAAALAAVALLATIQAGIYLILEGIGDRSAPAFALVGRAGGDYEPHPRLEGGSRSARRRMPPRRRSDHDYDEDRESPRAPLPPPALPDRYSALSWKISPGEF